MDCGDGAGGSAYRPRMHGARRVITPGFGRLFAAERAHTGYDGVTSGRAKTLVPRAGRRDQGHGAEHTGGRAPLRIAGVLIARRADVHRRSALDTLCDAHDICSCIVAIPTLRRSGVHAFDLGAYGNVRVAPVILARNEERTIGDAVAGAKSFVHEVVVMDGRSSDDTVADATAAGARVFPDPGRGKGSAIRQSLDVVDADVLVFI